MPNTTFVFQTLSDYQETQTFMENLENKIFTIDPKRNLITKNTTIGIDQYLSIGYDDPLELRLSIREMLSMKFSFEFYVKYATPSQARNDKALEIVFNEYFQLFLDHAQDENIVVNEDFSDYILSVLEETGATE